MKTSEIIVALTLLTGTLAHAAEPLLVIENQWLKVAVDPASGTFQIAEKAAGRVVVKDGRLAGGNGPAKRVAAGDKTFGEGQAIEAGPARVALFPQLPFALLRRTLRNDAAEPQTLNKVPLVTFGLELWKAKGTVPDQPSVGARSDENRDSPLKPANLKTLGTGGLASPERSPGSYAWLAIAEPQSRNGLVVGWLTHDRASGVLFPTVAKDQVQIEARGEYGRVRLAPGQSTETETLAVGYFDDARLGLEAWADAVVKVYKIKLPPLPTGYCTWYSNKHGGAGDEKSLAELTAFAAKNLKPWGFQFVQIDDQWQAGDCKGNGPNKNFTTHRPGGPYPGGMKAAADNIKKFGLMPGLWFMPFAGTYNDPWFKDHQDWFAKTADGKPYDTAWGGTCLDMTNPAAREYLRSIVHRIAKEWGYTYFKMDGLWTGTATKQIYVNSGYKEDGMGDAVFHNPDKTNIEAYRDGLKLVRETAGRDVFFLGCCAPQNMRSYAGAFGLVDAMRIGPDNGGSWGGWAGVSPAFGTRNYHLHGRIWYNDPDPVYARTNIPLGEVKTMCSWTAIAGQLNASSDWLPELGPERIEVLRRTMPAHGLLARPVDLFETSVPRVWLLSDARGTPRRDVVALYNWDNAPLDFDLPLARIGLPEGEYAAFDFWGNTLLPHTLKGNLKTTVAPHGCQILAVRPVSRDPQVLSTSRHVTQGIVDLVEEKWDTANQTLSGRSKVVAGDPYELRIVSTDRPAVVAKMEGTKSVLHQSDGLLRVTIESRESREVGWSVRFQK